MTDSDIQHAKRELRTIIKERLRAMTADDRRKWSGQIASRFLELDEAKRTGYTLAYFPLPDEVDARPIILALLERGVTVCIPKIDWSTNTMRPALIRSLDDPYLVEDRYGLKSLHDKAPEIEPTDLDLVIVPGLGFDSECRRLGRGAGFCDRFLAESGFTGRSIGVGYDLQVVDAIPAGGHDVRLDAVVTESRLLVKMSL